MVSFRYTLHAASADRALLGGISQNETHVEVRGLGDAAFQVRIAVPLAEIAPNALWAQPWLHLTHGRTPGGPRGHRKPQKDQCGGSLLSAGGPPAEFLCLSVGPQKATTLAEYRGGAHDALAALWADLSVSPQGEMVFDHEWWRYCHYEEGVQGPLVGRGGALDAIFQTALLDKGLLENYTRLEIVSSNGKDVVLELWGETDTVVIPRSGNGAVSSEFALFLEVDPNDTSPNRSLEGVRAKVGEGDLELIPTLVFPMPQHVFERLGASHAFLTPHGMHPVYNVSLEAEFLENAQDMESRGCSLNFNVDLPKQFIVDKYQLEGLMGRSGDTTCISGMEISNSNAIDLELPDYEVHEFGSTVHLQLDASCVANNMGFQLPLHLRYAAPNRSGIAGVKMAPGDLYWKCQLGSDEWDTMANSFLYESGRLGITKLQDLQNMRYHHIPVRNSSLTLNVPVAQISHLKNVETATILLVILSTLAILYSCFNNSKR